MRAAYCACAAQDRSPWPQQRHWRVCCARFEARRANAAGIAGGATTSITYPVEGPKDVTAFVREQQPPATVATSKWWLLPVKTGSVARPPASLLRLAEQAPPTVESALMQLVQRSNGAGVEVGGCYAGRATARCAYKSQRIGLPASTSACPATTESKAGSAPVTGLGRSTARGYAPLANGRSATARRPGRAFTSARVSRAYRGGWWRPNRRHYAQSGTGTPPGFSRGGV